MLRKPVESSDSVKKTKHKKSGFGDDYGIKLLKEDQEKLGQEESSSSDDELDQKIDIMVKL